MTLLDPALRGALAPTPRERSAEARPSVLMAGAGGMLGAAVLEALLGSGRLSGVTVLTRQPMAVVTPGLSLRSIDNLALGAVGAVAGDAPESGKSPSHRPPKRAAADLALVVFDRPRHANGRDDAFWLPQPRDLPALAEALQREGVQRLVVVCPTDAARWPQALREGLASLDEQAVASLPWRQFLIVRPAESAQSPSSSGLQRIADTVLAQLRLMVPTAQQPVRTSALALLLAELVAWLPTAADGARVLPADRVWQVVQAGQSNSRSRWLDAWWQGHDLAPVSARPGRL